MRRISSSSCFSSRDARPTCAAGKHNPEQHRERFCPAPAYT
jgi:hypothetical protein